MGKNENNGLPLQKDKVWFESIVIDIDARIDLSVSKDITLEQFECMALTFHDAMFQYCH